MAASHIAYLNGSIDLIWINAMANHLELSGPTCKDRKTLEYKAIKYTRLQGCSGYLLN